MAWIELENKFEPSTKSALISLKREFSQSCLEDPNQDPDKWLQELEALRRRMINLGHVITDGDLILHVLNNLP
jgi:hypothetical protein